MAGDRPRHPARYHPGPLAGLGDADCVYRKYVHCPTADSGVPAGQELDGKAKQEEREGRIQASTAWRKDHEPVWIASSDDARSNFDRYAYRCIHRPFIRCE